MNVEEQKARLRALLMERSVRLGKFKLASGRESDFFIDCKQAVLTAEGHALIGELMYEALSKLPACDAVGGVELGGCSLASSVSLVSHQKGRDLPALYIRKARKDHGTTKMVEGDRSLFDGIRVVLLEDAVTTGGSALRAIKPLQEAGAQVVGILAIVDRKEGGEKAMQEANMPFASLFTRHDFITAAGTPIA